MNEITEHDVFLTEEGGFRHFAGYWIKLFVRHPNLCLGQDHMNINRKLGYGHGFDMNIDVNFDMGMDMDVCMDMEDMEMDMTMKKKHMFYIRLLQFRLISVWR
jgi:hypothetical protein